MNSQTRYSEIMERFANCRIAVVGDLMLDVYLWGKVTRISPEAPVPVIRINRRNSCLGGAGNVMLNLANLGARVSAFGMTGDDQTGDEIAALLREQNIDCCCIRRDGGRRTTEKRRVLSGSQQLLREDYEDIHAAPDVLRREMAEILMKKIRRREIDAIIFEDYGKGLLSAEMVQPLIAEAGKCGIITSLDPKPGSLAPVKGLTVIKPNRTEAFAMAGIGENDPAEIPQNDAGLAAAAAVLRERWAPEYLLISLAAQGMALFGPADLKVIPTRAREVYDVSGAGDTVTAVFSLSMAAGASPEEAAELANRAAGVVVAKIGTVPVVYEELKGALEL